MIKTDDDFGIIQINDVVDQLLINRYIEDANLMYFEIRAFKIPREMICSKDFNIATAEAEFRRFEKICDNIRIGRKTDDQNR